MLHGLARLADAGLHEPRPRPRGDGRRGWSARPRTRRARTGRCWSARAESCSWRTGSRPRPPRRTRSPASLPPTPNTRRASCWWGRRARCSPHGRCRRSRGRSASRRCGARARARCSPAGIRTGCGRRTSRGHKHRYVGAGHGFAGNVLALGDAADAVAVVRALGDRGGASGQVGQSSTRTAGPRPPRACSGATARPGSSPRWLISGATTPSSARCWRRAASSSGTPARWPTRRRPLPRHGGQRLRLPAAARAHGRRALAGPARAFALHALGQVDRFRARHGRGRYSLFTGDIGAALLAAACLSGDARFPGLDDL